MSNEMDNELYSNLERKNKELFKKVVELEEKMFQMERRWEELEKYLSKNRGTIYQSILKLMRELWTTKYKREKKRDNGK